MPPLRSSVGRASKACASCAVRKTRCYASGTSRACLRCKTLALSCSLEATSTEPARDAVRHSCALAEQRISRLEQTVEQLSALLGHSGFSRPQFPHGVDIQGQQNLPLHNYEQPAPLNVIQDAAAAEIGRNIDEGDQEIPHRETIVSKGLITKSEANVLLTTFQLYYARWIGLEETERITTESIRSPLLLCVCCLIVDSTSPTAHDLFHEAKGMLGESSLHVQSSIEFFQAVIILALWSTSLGQRLLSIDSWMITGVALQQTEVSHAFKSITAVQVDGGHDMSRRHMLAVWNHLCLAHLHACVSMRRKSMVTRADIEKSRQILQGGEATHFQTRMVAELFLYITIYEQCIVKRVNLHQAKAALLSWKEEWAFLFDQPRRQFLQTSFWFAGLLIYEQSLTSKSAAVRESVVSDMVRLSSDILKLFMETADERTKHLTDHVYHVVTFAAVTLCRLLCRYETPELKARLSLGEMDELIHTFINWLQSLDTAPHISKIMSRLIRNVQSRLRPDFASDQLELGIQQTSPNADAMPELFGMDDNFDFSNVDWDAIIPDWQSVDSADLMNNVVST